MLQKVKCRHCVVQFQPIRAGHIYCSSTCRKLQFSSKKRAENRKQNNLRRISFKLRRLSASSFGKYLIREIRRAGTVQILQGHDADSLRGLVALRRKCTNDAGFSYGESLGAYELSHIYPVGNAKSKRIGLLHPKNLAITPKDFNRKHSTKEPSYGYKGESIARDDLLTCWSVTQMHDAMAILKLARRYIGEQFDVWLKGHVISITQKQGLVKDLTRAGFHQETLKKLDFKQLREMALDEDVAYFYMTNSPSDTRRVLAEELRRLALGGDIAECILLLEGADCTIEPAEKIFDGADIESRELEAHLIQQGLNCLHGQPFSEQWKGRAFLSFFVERPKYEYKRDDDWGDYVL